MKLTKLVLLFACVLLLTNCGKDDAPTISINFPESLVIDIPGAISANTGPLTGRTSGDGDGLVEADEIYESLRTYINVGEKSAEFMQTALQLGEQLDKEDVTILDFISEFDEREKRIELFNNVRREGFSYEYELLMFDLEANEWALQLLWNSDPVEGVGVIRPFHFDRNEDDARGAFVRIDYTELSEEYDIEMNVAISDREVVENGDVSSMKFFVGQKGNIVELWGNTHHPDIIIADKNVTTGRNYAFVARGDQLLNLAVVKLALPPSTYTSNDVFEKYSVMNVLQEEIENGGITDLTEIAAILKDAQSPAYYDQIGFIVAGENNLPGNFEEEFVDLSGFAPYVPQDIKNLSVGFITSEE